MTPAVETSPDPLDPWRDAPRNIEAEMALLGALLIDNGRFRELDGLVAEDDFHAPAHGRIFAAVAALLERGRAANPVTLLDHFAADDGLRDVGGAAYLARLAASAVSVRGAADYAATVRELSLRRHIIARARHVAMRARHAGPDDDAEILLAEAAAAFAAIDPVGRGEFTSLGEAASRSLALIEQAARSPDGIVGCHTGFAVLDDMLGGLRPGNLVILAGRPSMGKTALATNIAVNVAALHEGPQGGDVLFFSLEMPAEELANRVLSARSGLANQALQRGRLDREDFRKLTAARHGMAATGLHIDDTAGLTIEALASRARRFARRTKQSPPVLVVVDYLQLVQSRARPENRTLEIGLYTQRLKALARQLACPVLCLSQLSRANERRDDKRPQLSDLRDSGAIEQDADVVLFVHREEYYLERARPEPEDPRHADWLARMSRWRDRAEVLIRKARNARTGSAALKWQPSVQQFLDLDDSPEPEKDD